MRKFFKYTLINICIPVVLYFSILLLPGMKLSDSMLRYSYKPDLEYAGWVDHYDSVYGVILGSSTLRYGLSCSEIKKNNETWVNLSMDARDPVEFYLLLEKLFTNHKPKVVIVGLDPWIYTKHYYKYRSNVMYFDLTPAEKIHYFIHQDRSLPKKLYQYLLFYFYDDINFIGNKKSEANKIPPIPNDNGSVKLTQKAVNFEEVKVDWFEIDKYGWSDVQFESLKKIAQICRKNNARLLFVIPPKRNDYIYWAKRKFSKEHQEWWTRICDSIPGEFIANNLSDLAQYNQDSIFEEAYHLNMSGQKIYSDLVAAHIDSAAVISPSDTLFFK